MSGIDRCWIAEAPPGVVSSGPAVMYDAATADEYREMGWMVSGPLTHSAAKMFPISDNGSRAVIEPWDNDHTALVHVLWAAERDGLTITNADELASRIMQSKWMKAVRQNG